MQSIRNSRDGIVGRAKSSADAPKIEAFAQAFLERLAGSQGRALRRAPQSAESPLDFRFCENQPKNKKKAPSADGAMLRAQSALIRKDRPLGRSFLFLFVLIDSRVGHRESKGFFEPAGSTRFHLDGLKGLVP